ncbi:uncharacterized protein LOC101864425 [Aplysia californica]|uniref:Uncharacterized protein LOC101864425 n=1 Tax=Aplysia californica TaxID=6500 RepID=A0ABM0K7Z7_APLCA|nr:uncharacterized protein LOC101864425 [Aplysia californica]
MSLFRKSLSEDGVDRYSHLWSVLLLLTLALVTWLLPFSPTISSSYLATQPSEQPLNRLEPPTYHAKCGVPPEFRGSNDDYTNRICASFVNSAYRGEKKNVSLYRLTEDSGPINTSSKERFKPKLMTTSNLGSRSYRQMTSQDASLGPDMYLFLAVTVPLALFLFAVCLKLPLILFRLMSGCGSINVERTLDTARGGLTLDAESRRELNFDLSRAATESAKTSRGVALSYLMFKLLLCVVTLVELVILGSFLMPQLTQLKDRNDNPGLVPGASTQTSPDLHSKAYEFENDMLLICELEIYQLQNVATFNLQCLFSYDEGATADHSRVGAETQGTSDQHLAGDVLNGYHALLTAVLAYLVILLVVNVLSLITWTSKLVFGIFRSSLLQGSSSLSLDLSFLLLMSQENNGPLVTQELAGHLTSATGLDRVMDKRTIE